MSFPKRIESQNKGDVGVQIISKAVAKDLRMIFRTIPQEYDYGIDGHIDYVTASGDVTGGCVAVQIKYGDSYFKNKAVDGFWYTGEEKHLNFLMNHTLPVFIFLVHPNESIYWVEFDSAKLQKSGSQWKILVPKENKLLDNFVERLENIFDIVDFSTEVKNHLDTVDVMRTLTGEVKHTLLAIGRSSIEAQNTQGAVSFFDSLKVNKQTIKKHEGKISFFVYGYDEDKRELYEIPEVVEYFKKLEREVKYWFYFLSKDKQHSQSLKVLISLICEAKQNEGKPRVIELDPDKRVGFFEENFNWLNEMTDFLDLPMSENKRISQEVFDYFEWIELPEK